MPLVFHVFIAVAIMAYLVAVMVCGRHGLYAHTKVQLNVSAQLRSHGRVETEHL